MKHILIYQFETIEKYNNLNQINTNLMASGPLRPKYSFLKRWSNPNFVGHLFLIFKEMRIEHMFPSLLVFDANKCNYCITRLLTHASSIKYLNIDILIKYISTNSNICNTFNIFLLCILRIYLKLYFHIWKRKSLNN